MSAPLRSSQTLLVCLLAALLAVVSACASGSADTSGQDDAGPHSPDASNLGAFGDPCVTPMECESGICLGADGDTPGSCSSDCTDGCPSGYACSTDENPVCIPAIDFLCRSCVSDADCGGENNRCVTYDAGSFCASTCANDSAGCPTGFSCQAVQTEGTSLGLLCMSDSGLCCIDGDGDVRGVGDGCRATDCDDTDPDIYDDALELCDGKDNDCSGGVDNEVTDCGAADCRLGSNGYVMQAAQTCLSGGCVEQPEVLCGLYTCSGGGAEGDE
jgi:hypothetical protein